MNQGPTWKPHKAQHDNPRSQGHWIRFIGFMAWHAEQDYAVYQRALAAERERQNAWQSTLEHSDRQDLWIRNHRLICPSFESDTKDGHPVTFMPLNQRNLVVIFWEKFISSWNSRRTSMRDGMTSMNLECEVNEILSEPLQRSGPAHLEGQIRINEINAEGEIDTQKPCEWYEVILPFCSHFRFQGKTSQD